MLLILIAQSTAIPTVPDMTWWQTYGPLGGITGVVVLIIVAYLWLVHFPHKIALQKQEREHEARVQQQELDNKTETERIERETQKARQEIEIERERRGLQLFETLRVGFVADQEYKHRQTENGAKMTALMERSVATQERHAKECAATLSIVQLLAAGKQVPVKCQGDDCDHVLNGTHHFTGGRYLCEECFQELTPTET